MEGKEINKFGFLDVLIEDGFKYGDWRDQCVSDILYEQGFSPINGLFDNQTYKDFNEPQLSRDEKSILKKASLMDYKNDLKKIRKSNIVDDDSPMPAENNNLSRSFKSVNSEESYKNMIKVAAKYPRKNIHLRKDVINKTIIRAIIRFYIKHFKPKLNFKSKTKDFIFTGLKQNVNGKITSSASYQEDFGIVDDDSQNLIVSIITWITCSKSMKVKLKRYFDGIEEVQILDDVLSSYSHEKFSKMYKYEKIQTLFEVFMAGNREEFLCHFTGIQKARYEEELRTIAAGFNKQQWEPFNINKRFKDVKISIQ